ncbi:MAG: hypothetical protein Kow0099_15560 [Candidatus Abyssubacteria bacterium]
MSNDAKGLTITGLSSRFYDRFNEIFGFGTRFRERIVNEASLKPGERVLDCGCGTGTLAIIAKKQVGPGGGVHGIDLSKDQLAVAVRKSRMEGLDIAFHEGSIDELPFRDHSFDAIFCTLMLHHVPASVKIGAFREMRRALRSGGRVVIADFGRPAHALGWVLTAPLMLSLLATRSTRDNLMHRLPRMMADAGFSVTEQTIIKEVVHVIKAV